ncbi:hypothetical protein [Pleionea sp. CnH1-48]|uniref:hypothetical protein n=1 Tax=Pleionea sp. CnH1-48 TaxID=2954494 RepID=UPI002097366D|nr:hypothetical protein [Pleionea sp. CnH1-48]MCO7224288.1 hypothetical protein [Pleionea sp. CnH1-48]
MDIWSWVYRAEEELRESGQERLADIMDKISTYTCDDEHDKVDAIYPEGLALAKKHPNKWIEVFLRHWYLQSQVLHRYNAKGALNDAVELLELSHREETKECPQSICAVQDLSNCYSIKDGPGFAPEVMSVCEETLAKIDVNWPCYECINSEYVEGLMNNGDYQQALDRIKRVQEDSFVANNQNRKSILPLSEFSALYGLGRFEDAEKVARESVNHGGGESFLRSKQANIALALVRQQKYQEAIDASLPYSEVLTAQEHYYDWCELQYYLAQGIPERNTQELNACFNELIEKLIHNGAIRKSIMLKHWQAELALLREDLFTVNVCLQALEQLIPELHRDLGATENLEKLKSEYEQKLETYRAEADVSQLSELDNDALLDCPLLLLQEAYKVHQSHQIGNAYGEKLCDSGYSEQGLEVFQHILDKELDVPEVLLNYGHYLLVDQQTAEFDRFFVEGNFEHCSQNSQNRVNWIVACRYKNAEPALAFERTTVLLQQMPDSIGFLRLAAKLALSLQKYDTAIAYYNHLIELEPEQRDWHFDRMVVATLAQEWELVRASCQILEIELSTDSGPIDEDFGRIRVRVKQENNEPAIVLAQRTGPVSARVIEIRRLGEEQFFDAELVFDAEALNRLDHEDAEGYRCDSEGYYTLLFDAIEVVNNPEHFYFAIDGVHPGETQWQQLCEQLIALGAVVSQRNSDEYEVFDEESEKELAGIYAYVLLPYTSDLAVVEQTLSSVTADFEHPLIWPMLLEKLRDQEGLERHAAIEQRYNL